MWLYYVDPGMHSSLWSLLCVFIFICGYQVSGYVVWMIYGMFGGSLVLMDGWLYMSVVVILVRYCIVLYCNFKSQFALIFTWLALYSYKFCQVTLMYFMYFLLCIMLLWLNVFYGRYVLLVWIFYGLGLGYSSGSCNWKYCWMEGSLKVVIIFLWFRLWFWSGILEFFFYWSSLDGVYA